MAPTKATVTYKRRDLMPQIYERSIIRFGDEGGCVISLPIAWLRYYGLGPGDKLDMIVNGDIIIRRKEKPVPENKPDAGDTAIPQV